MAVIISVLSLAKAADKIIHDAEHNILLAQHGERWAKEDKEISAKLAEIRNWPTKSQFEGRPAILGRQPDRRA